MWKNIFSISVLLTMQLASQATASEVNTDTCVTVATTSSTALDADLSVQDIWNQLRSDTPAPALKALNRAALRGAPWALRQLSVLYRDGTILMHRPECTRQLLVEAASTGDTGAEIDLANLLLQPPTTADDIKQAQSLLNQAADTQDAWTLINIASAYTTGVGIPVDAKKAAALYERAALLHNDAALVQLGSLYRTGLGAVAADPAKAVDYFTQAAMGGNNAARVNLALMLLAGTPARDNEKALALLKQAVDDKDVWATTLLADVYQRGELLPADGDAAIKLLQPLADADNAAAITGLGDVYSKGAGTVAANADLARSLYERAATLGDLGAKNKLGLMLIDPQALRLDVPRGVALLEEVADAGDAWANMQVGDLYSKGDIVPVDSDKALARYQKAAVGGVAAGLVRISGLYAAGVGTIKVDARKASDYLEQAVALGDNTGRVLLSLDLIARSLPAATKRALGLLDQAASSGDVWASTLLAGYYVDGTKVAADGAKVIALLQPLADQHQPAAIAGLGDLYRKGAGAVATDPKKALDFYQAAAELGDLGAKNKLGLMLVDPVGPELDVPRGLALLREVAASGDGWAMIQTGDVLASGKGVPLDADAAIQYYKNAAAAGIPAGYVRLGEVYRTGLGTVAADAKAAMDYFQRAIARNDDTARIELAQMLLDSARKADREQALVLLGEAAGNDSIWALTILADYYSSGRGHNPDYSLALQSYRRLIDLGQTGAKLQIGLALVYGPLADKHAAEGIAMVRDAVADRQPNAVVEFARLQSLGKILGDDGKDAERSLIAQIKQGNPTALRYLLQLYRGGGANFKPQLAKAQKLFDANEGLLQPHDAAFEAIALTAMRPATAGNMALIARHFGDLRGADVPQSLQVLFWSNKNAYVYMLQQRMKQEGRFKGRVSGILYKDSISAIRSVCEKVASREQCGQGPLAPANAVAVSNYFLGSL